MNPMTRTAARAEAGRGYGTGRAADRLRALEQERSRRCTLRDMSCSFSTGTSAPCSKCFGAGSVRHSKVALGERVYFFFYPGLRESIDICADFETRRCAQCDGFGYLIDALREECRRAYSVVRNRVVEIRQDVTRAAFDAEVKRRVSSKRCDYFAEELSSERPADWVRAAIDFARSLDVHP